MRARDYTNLRCEQTTAAISLATLRMRRGIPMRTPRLLFYSPLNRLLVRQPVVKAGQKYRAGIAFSVGCGARFERKGGRLRDRCMKTQRGLLLVFCLAALSFFSLAVPCLADKRVALVIGNGAYKNSPTLANPPNDAADVAEALKAIGFEVTLKIDLEKRQMDQAVAQFAREGRGADAVLFYYAGHGMQYGGRNYLMPVDAELEDEVSLRYEMVGFDDVKSMMQRSPGIKIMVLDACRDNPLAERFVRSITLSTRDVSIARGFAPVEGAQGVIVVYATQVDDVAQDGTGRNSPFSAAFLKEIKEPGPGSARCSVASPPKSTPPQTGASRPNCRFRWFPNIT